jgi:sulfatase maturation enzyme AslB (radical SAM superfamily)
MVTSVKQHKKRISADIISGPEFGDFANPFNPLEDHPVVLNIFPVDTSAEYLAEEALKRDLSRVEKLRFDPVNTCNISCIFCPWQTAHKKQQIKPSTFEKIMHVIAPTCRRVIFGCAFECLMAKNIHEYGAVIAHAFDTVFKTKPLLSIATNGQLLNERDIACFIPSLSWIHITITSHRKDHYEFLQRGAKFERMTTNIKQLRKQYPSLRIHFEMIVNKYNLMDIKEYVPWAFMEMKADSINLRRVSVIISQIKSPLAMTLNSSNNIVEVSDDEWNDVVKLANELWPDNSSSTVSVQEHSRTSVIEIDSSVFK